MRFYSFNKPNQEVTWAKYFEDYDNELNGLINYIDLSNPNYLVLNYSYLSATEAVTLPFYTEAELVSLGIKEETNNGVVIHAYNLKPHQGIVNNYGTAYIKYSSSGQLYTFKQGYVIISRALTATEKNNPDCYLYHAMGASGTYYVPQGWAPLSVWRYTPNATDKYGIKSFFTVANNGTRWYCKNGDTSKNYLKSVSAVSSSIIIINSFTAQDIVSRQNSWWGISYQLGTELYRLENGVYEDFICDESFTTYVHVNDAGENLHYHRLDTNIPSDLISNLYVNYY